MIKYSSKILDRQLKKLGISKEVLPTTENDWMAFLESIQTVYDQYEEGRYLLERSLEISSTEMLEEIKRNKKISLQLAQAEKLAALGTLTSGIAQEISDPLANIKKYAEQLHLKEKSISPTEQSKYVEKIIILTKQMTETIHSMLNLSKNKEAGEKTIVNLNDIINETLNLLRAKFKAEDIKFNFNIKASSLLIEGNQNQLLGVFQSLFFNSRDSFLLHKEIKNKSITITMTDSPKDSLKIIYTDNAGGMTNENIHKMLDPFFTTKDFIATNGLGMAISKHVIDDLGGSLSIETNYGTGTQFTIVLKKYIEKKQIRKISEVELKTENLQLLKKDQYRILIVEDKPEIFEYLSEGLHAFDLKFCRDKTEAVKHVRTFKFDLVISDIRSSKVDTFQLGNLLRGNGFKMPIIFLSGQQEIEPNNMINRYAPAIIIPGELPSIKEFNSILNNLISKKEQIAA